MKETKYFQFFQNENWPLIGFKRQFNLNKFMYLYNYIILLMNNVVMSKCSKDGFFFFFTSYYPDGFYGGQYGIQVLNLKKNRFDAFNTLIRIREN